MEGIQFLKKPKLKNPILITAWPGMGEVAYKAATYLIEHLKAEEFAYLASSDFFYPTGSTIKEGLLGLADLPGSRFYYWKRPKVLPSIKEANDLIIFVSNAQPDLANATNYGQKILDVARLYKVKTIINFAAMPVPIEHTQKPEVWFCATHKELFKWLSQFNLKMMAEGEISGMNGLFLGLARQTGFSGFSLLGEIPIYTIHIENPKAVLAVLEKLKRILNLPLDLKDLEKQAEFIEGEINKLVDYLKAGLGLSTMPGPISEAEIEKIRKSLSELPKLPQSIKEKIEKLFELAKKDITKSNELKQELDKWGVYKEYEDRFLDLFKKPKDKGN